MCHFLTLVVPEIGETKLKAILVRHGRTMVPVANPSVARLLKPGERQYVTAHHCDCGTTIGAGLRAEEAADAFFAQELPKQKARLSRIGWSDAKIERWTRDRVAANSRSDFSSDVDTIEGWLALLDDLGKSGADYAGLLLHLYSGALDADFDCDRDPERRKTDRAEALSMLAEDRLTLFATRA